MNFMYWVIVFISGLISVVNIKGFILDTNNGKMTEERRISYLMNGLAWFGVFLGLVFNLQIIMLFCLILGTYYEIIYIKYRVKNYKNASLKEYTVLLILDIFVRVCLYKMVCTREYFAGSVFIILAYIVVIIFSVVSGIYSAKKEGY